MKLFKRSNSDQFKIIYPVSRMRENSSDNGDIRAIDRD